MLKKTLHNKQWNGSLIMAIVIGIYMLWELEKMINFPGSDNITWWMLISELVMFGMVLSKIDFRKNPWMEIMLAGLLLIFITSAIRPSIVLENTKMTLMRGVLVYILCPSVALLLSRKELQAYLQIFLCIWVTFHTVLSAVGIYCMYHGIQIIDYSLQYEINNNGGVLKLMAYHTVSAANLTLAIMMALIGMTMCRKQIAKALYFVGILIMLYALGLTTGRAGMIATGIGLGIALAALFVKRYHTKWKHKWILILLCICIVLVSMVGTYEVLSVAQSSFNGIVQKINQGEIPGTAYADSLTLNQHAIGQIRPRDVGVYGISGRERGYRIAFRLLKEKPYLLLTGTSVPLVMEYINKTEYLGFDHIHCLPLQILLETGIWGLALFVIFLVFLVKAVWKLFFATEQPFWMNIIYLPTVCMLIIEIVECITRLEKGLQAAVPAMFFAGITLHLSKHLQEPGYQI